jgi:predicted RNA-binding protein Jag
MRRNNFLKKKAEAIAHIVLQTGREMALDPLTKKEQQVVENRLAEMKGVKIYTIGKGVSKNVIIAHQKMLSWILCRTAFITVG